MNCREVLGTAGLCVGLGARVLGCLAGSAVQGTMQAIQRATAVQQCGGHMCVGLVLLAG